MFGEKIHDFNETRVVTRPLGFRPLDIMPIRQKRCRVEFGGTTFAYRGSTLQKQKRDEFLRFCIPNFDVVPVPKNGELTKAIYLPSVVARDRLNADQSQRGIIDIADESVTVLKTEIGRASIRQTNGLAIEFDEGIISHMPAPPSPS
jgi:hypothetical protein